MINRILFWIVFFSCPTVLLSQQTDTLYSNTEIGQLLEVLQRKATVRISPPDPSFIPNQKGDIYQSDRHRSRITTQIVPIAYQKLLPKFEEDYVITSARKLLAKTAVTVDQMPGTLYKFYDSAQGGYIHWVVLFGDQEFCYTVGGGYPETKDPELGLAFEKTLKSAKRPQ